MQYRSFRSIAVSMLLFAGGSLLAQPKDTMTYSFTLQQAIDHAFKNQVNVQNAVLEEESAKYRAKEVTAAGLPQVNGNINVTDFLDIPTQVVPADFFGGPPGTYLGVQFGTQYSATAGVDISQLVFSGEYIVALKSTQTFLDLTRKATNRTKVETAVAVTKAYYTVLVNEERMKLLDANVARLKKLKEDATALNQTGFVEKIDVDRITLTYNNLVTEQDKVKRYLGLSLSMLKFQAGIPQAATLTLADKLTDVNLQPDIATDKFNYSNRIEYSLLESQRNFTALGVKRDKFAYLPSFALFGSFSLNAFRDEFNFFDFNEKWYPTSLIGARLNIPIFSSGMRRYKVQQSEVALKKAQNNLKMLEQGIDLELAGARINLENAAATLESQKKNITLAEDVFRMAKLKYEQGVGSNLEVLNAETSLKEAQTNYFGALFDALVARVDYDKATGKLIK